MRGQFLSALEVRNFGDGRHFILSHPFIYQMRDGRIIEVPMEFVTDFASIPWPFRMVLPREGRYDFAAVLHDYAFRSDSVPTFPNAGAANQLMKDAMEDSPFPPNWITRWLVNAGLKIGSRHFFHQHPVMWRPKGVL